MLRDPVVLGDNYILDGAEVGTQRPNDNQLVTGISGCGKSTSVLIPTLGRMKYSNPILSYAKEADGLAAGRFLAARGYHVDYLNVANPSASTAAFDPILCIKTPEDIESLADAIVLSCLKKTVDDYWNSKARPLLAALIQATLKMDRNPSFATVLERFDNLIVQESNSGGITTPLARLFSRLESMCEKSPMAAREYKAFCCLPFKTASCVRDTLASCLSTVFPDSIRQILQNKPQFQPEKFAHGKNALVVITNAIDSSQELYANLFYRMTIRALLRYANTLPGACLPRPVRLIFDDFACTAPIADYEKDISLFRSAGISALMLLQSENQLESIYGADKAAIIRQNCSTYAYFPGGFDDRSCQIVSKRMNLPYEEVLYAPLGKVFIMQTGRMPVHIPRYRTLEMPEYAQYRKANHMDGIPGGLDCLDDLPRRSPGRRLPTQGGSHTA